MSHEENVTVEVSEVSTETKIEVNEAKVGSIPTLSAAPVMSDVDCSGSPKKEVNGDLPINVFGDENFRKDHDAIVAPTTGGDSTEADVGANWGTILSKQCPSPKPSEDGKGGNDICRYNIGVEVLKNKKRSETTPVTRLADSEAGASDRGNLEIISTDEDKRIVDSTTTSESTPTPSTSGTDDVERNLRREANDPPSLELSTDCSNYCNNDNLPSKGEQKAILDSTLPQSSKTSIKDGNPPSKGGQEVALHSIPPQSLSTSMEGANDRKNDGSASPLFNDQQKSSSTSPRGLVGRSMPPPFGCIAAELDLAAVDVIGGIGSSGGGLLVSEKELSSTSIARARAPWASCSSSSPHYKYDESKKNHPFIPEDGERKPSNDMDTELSNQNHHNHKGKECQASPDQQDPRTVGKTKQQQPQKQKKKKQKQNSAERLGYSLFHGCGESDACGDLQREQLPPPSLKPHHQSYKHHQHQPNQLHLATQSQPQKWTSPPKAPTLRRAPRPKSLAAGGGQEQRILTARNEADIGEFEKDSRGAVVAAVTAAVITTASTTTKMTTTRTATTPRGKKRVHEDQDISGVEKGNMMTIMRSSPLKKRVVLNGQDELQQERPAHEDQKHQQRCGGQIQEIGGDGEGRHLGPTMEILSAFDSPHPSTRATDVPTPPLGSSPPVFPPGDERCEVQRHGDEDQYHVGGGDAHSPRRAEGVVSTDGTIIEGEMSTPHGKFRASPSCPPLASGASGNSNCNVIGSGVIDTPSGSAVVPVDLDHSLVFSPMEHLAMDNSVMGEVGSERDKDNTVRVCDVADGGRDDEDVEHLRLSCNQNSEKSVERERRTDRKRSSNAGCHQMGEDDVDDGMNPPSPFSKFIGALSSPMHNARDDYHHHQHHDGHQESDDQENDDSGPHGGDLVSTPTSHRRSQTEREGTEEASHPKGHGIVPEAVSERYCHQQHQQRQNQIHRQGGPGVFGPSTVHKPKRSGVYRGGRRNGTGRNGAVTASSRWHSPEEAATQWKNGAAHNVKNQQQYLPQQKQRQQKDTQTRHGRSVRKIGKPLSDVASGTGRDSMGGRQSLTSSSGYGSGSTSFSSPSLSSASPPVIRLKLGTLGMHNTEARRGMEGINRALRGTPLGGRSTNRRNDGSCVIGGRGSVGELIDRTSPWDCKNGLTMSPTSFPGGVTPVNSMKMATANGTPTSAGSGYINSTGSSHPRHQHQSTQLHQQHRPALAEVPIGHFSNLPHPPPTASAPVPPPPYVVAPPQAVPPPPSPLPPLSHITPNGKKQQKQKHPHPQQRGAMGGVGGQIPALGKENETPKSHKQNPCNCKKSKCLKLYCECFAAERYCRGCNCVDCNNNLEFEHVRSEAIKATRAKNPNAFKPRFEHKHNVTDNSISCNPSAGHNMGCRCKKSACLKKYCECFEAGVMCGDKCKCLDCMNYVGSQALIDRRRKIKDMRGAEIAMRTADRAWKSGVSGGGCDSTGTGSAARNSGEGHHQQHAANQKRQQQQLNRKTLSGSPPHHTSLPHAGRHRHGKAHPMNASPHTSSGSNNSVGLAATTPYGVPASHVMGGGTPGGAGTGAGPHRGNSSSGNSGGAPMGMGYSSGGCGSGPSPGIGIHPVTPAFPPNTHSAGGGCSGVGNSANRHFHSARQHPHTHHHPKQQQLPHLSHHPHHQTTPIMTTPHHPHHTSHPHHPGYQHQHHPHQHHPSHQNYYGLHHHGGLTTPATNMTGCIGAGGGTTAVRLHFDASSSKKARRVGPGGNEPTAPVFGREAPDQPKTTALTVFSFLSNAELFNASLVSKAWNSLTLDEELWQF